MFFSFDVLQARKGDCFLLHYGSETDPGLVLIDGGPSKVYKPHLKPRLEKIRESRGLDDDQSLAINLLMVSHIDDDHIKGILELTEELVDAQDSGQPLPVKVKSVWHNTFDDVVGKKPDELLSAVTASFGDTALSGDPDGEGIDAGLSMVMASVGQGRQLRDDIKKLNFSLNPEFDGRLVMATGGNDSIDMGKGLILTVIGPEKTELEALQKQHDAYLKKHKDEQETEAALAAFTDSSVANLSSLVVLAEVDTRRILLTGDARGDKIMDSLELAGLLQQGETMHVDILKVPHHGSDRNIEPVFFRRITADHYVFSGNGEHGNPERETLQMLFDERGGEKLTIHLTYPLKDIDEEREKDWKKEQEKEKKRKLKKPETIVREDWSHDKHSLTAFFKGHENFAEKLSIADAGNPHVIDLLDQIAF